MRTKARIQLVPNFERVLNGQADVRAIIVAEAEKAKVVAKSTAPVGATGKYRDGIDVEVDLTGVRLVGRDFKSHWIEWGTSLVKAFATLRNAARQVTRHVRDA